MALTIKGAASALACAIALAVSTVPVTVQAAAPAKAAAAPKGKAALGKASAASAPLAPRSARAASASRNPLAARETVARRGAASLRDASPARVVKTFATPAASMAAQPVRTGNRAAARRGARLVQAEYVAPATSIGAAIGLKATDDPLDLRSSVAYVVDQDSGETLFDKNSHAVLPIASITKLMTALVTLEARLPMGEVLEITEAEIDTEKHTRSRLAVGTRLTRAELLHLALMASENRAAHALGRTYPGGLGAFVAAMNARARALGMADTVYNDPTGLSSRNQANARDLVKLLRVAFDHPTIRDYSVAPDLTVDTGHRVVTFRNTNRLVREHSWEIGLQKTGFINEAGNCLVMQARFEERRVWVVLLDAHGGAARASDAQRLRRFIGGAEPRSFSAVKARSRA